MRNGLFPTRRTLLLFTIPMIFFAASFWISILSFVGLFLDGFLLLAVMFDIILSPNLKRKFIIKLLPIKFLNLNRFSELVFALENNNKLPVKFNILLDLDISFDRNYSKEVHKIHPLTDEKLIIRLFAKRRGTFKLEEIFIKAKSLLGLLNFYRSYKQDIVLNVVPTTAAKGDSFKFIQKNIKKLEGSQKNRNYGDGKEFEMLRDYVIGDDFGKIDWKITAKQRKPVTRVYRIENNFELAIMLDCGRLLGTEVKDLSLLDYAVNASVVLSYAAVKSNDLVSLTAFNKSILNYIPPSKNMKTVKKFNHILTDLQYDYVESNYHMAFSFIKSKLYKRSLIVFFTDIIDDSNINIYHKYLSLLKRKHLVLLILLRDKNLYNTANAIPSKNISLFTKAGAIDLILRRNKAIFDLKRLGVEVLDLFPEEVTSSTLNKYLNIKSRF